MILDKGVAFFYEAVNTAQPGGMPVMKPAEKHFFASFFGELDFETAPARPTEKREEVRTDARIRVLQNRAIQNTQIVILIEDLKEKRYRITRAYHGTDDDTGEPITDLNLEVIAP